METKLETLLKQYESDNSQELFWEIYKERMADKSFKLTKLQQEVIENLKKGWYVVRVNESHKSNGQCLWNGEHIVSSRVFFDTIEAITYGKNYVFNGSYYYTPRGFYVRERDYIKN